MEALVTDASAADRAGETAEAVRLCSRALGLFRGELLAGLPGPFADLERLRLTERRIAVVQRKSEWQLRLGRHCEAIAELSAFSAAHPLNESVAAMLMRALYRGGRQADALSVFDRARHAAGRRPGGSSRPDAAADVPDDSARGRGRAGPQAGLGGFAP